MVNKRIDIFGTLVNITTIDEAPRLILMASENNVSGYMCLPDSYVIVSATKDEKLRDILNNSLMTFPDGAPLALYSKLKGVKNITSISGFWLIDKLMATDLSHYFYGSSEKELSKIKQRIENSYPNGRVLGYKSPPWVNLNEIEKHPLIEQDIAEINLLKPDIVWIGLNSPKQDYLMAGYSQKFDNSIMIGIGGVYDYLSGTMKISPEWVKKLSLRWVYRILQNPKRIYSKAIVAIIGFLWLCFKEVVDSNRDNKGKSQK
jgi:N-acetylglucosaminyldiphosphoundecaprenol N-acetyl-beta-D-mannosaminyltransferase